MAMSEDRRLPRWMSHPALRVGLALAVLAISFVTLHDLSRDVTLAALRNDLAGASLWAMLAALGFTLLSFLALSQMDVIALSGPGMPAVPRGVASLTGAAGAAITGLLGFSYLTALGVRLRIYTRHGLPPATVTEVFALAWFGYGAGLGLLIGGLLALDPAALPLPWPALASRLLGLALLLALLGLFAQLGRGRRRVGPVILPSFRIALGLLAVAVADALMASLVLYSLMPAGGPDYPAFLAIYIAAIGLGILSHTPGGLGVFEAAMLAGLGAAGRSDVLAALVLYRLIYTLLPFLCAVLALVLTELRGQTRRVGRYAGQGYRLLQPAVPLVSAAGAVFAGMILLISGSLPTDHDYLNSLSSSLPLPVVEVSHLMGSIAGVLLLVIARGLYRKLHSAWAMATALLAVGCAASVVVGMDWAETLGLLAACLTLLAFRPAFYRRSGSPTLRLSGPWIISLATLVAVVIWIGVFVHKHDAYRDALWWKFAWNGDASRFLRASLAASVVLAVISLNSLLWPRPKGAQPQPVPPQVRQLILSSPEAHPQVALLEDRSFLVSDDGRACLGYADTGRALIGYGDPIGEPKSAETLLWALRDQADRQGRLCAFVSVSAAFLPSFLDMGLSVLKFGEKARVDLAQFSLLGPRRKDFRHAHSRALREGLEFVVIPAAEVAPLLPALRRISDAWLSIKQGEEKGFALGSFNETYLQNFDHAVLRRAVTGEILAFANLWQGAERHEIAVDLMRHDPAAPGYVMDALFAALMLWAKDQGFAWFSLGSAPLSGLEKRRHATLWNRIGAFAFDHGERFYGFEGLHAFKQKFDPVWSPNYIVSPRGLATARVLFEVNSLISGGVAGLLTDD